MTVAHPHLRSWYRQISRGWLIGALALGSFIGPWQPGLFGQDQASGSIAGQITPQHDHPLTLATATLPDLGLQVGISHDGSFRFDQVTPGAHLLQVRVPTLGSAAERVVVEAGVEVVVTIEIKPGSHFEEVVVTAPGSARDALELANAVTSLSGQELQLRLQSSLGETLAQEPGVSSTFFGAGASRPIIRGLSGDRVRVLEGGIGSGDASGVSADHAVASDPSQAERIEILRGPATLLYGSSAIGGAVNVIDERIPTARASKPIGGTVDLRSGSVSDERQGAVNLNGGKGSWAWHLDAMARHTDDYHVPGSAVLERAETELEGNTDQESAFGVVPNSDIETRGGRLGVTRFFDSGFLGVSLSDFATEYGIPRGFEGAPANQSADAHSEETVRIDMEQRRVDLSAEIRDIGIFQAAKVRVGATDYEHMEIEGTEIGTLFFNDYLEGRLELVQRQRARSSGSIGLQYSDRELEAIGAEAFLPKTKTDRWALFSFQEIGVGAFRWQLGARFENQDIDPVGLDAQSHSVVSHWGLSGSVGLVWDLSDAWSMGASAARSVKLPAPEELFSRGTHVASQAFEIGNPNLEEEKGIGLDVSLRKNEGRVTGELTLFRQDFSDFIFQAFTGDVEDGFPVVLYRQQNAELAGVEMSGRIELLERNGHHLHLQIVGDVVDAELERGGDLPRIPPFRLGGGVHYHSERWSATAELRWVDDQTSVSVNETPTAGHTFINASLGYRLLFSDQIIDVLLRGRNLTDEEARSHTSFLKNVAPLPGRDLSLSLRLWF